MYKRILLAYDGSDSGQKALLDSRELAGWAQSELVLVAVMPATMGIVSVEGGVYDHALADREHERYEGVLADGLKRLAECGYKATGEVLVGESVHEIARYATKIEADLIVVGHKHLDSWAARWWRGSVSASLIEHAPCSVLVAITT